MTKLYISTDLGANSSGGTVSNHELNAMKELARETNDNVITLGHNDNHPTVYNLPDLPLLIDYLTLEKLSKIDLTDVNLAHFYGASYLQTIRFLKSKGIKTTNSIMFHDRYTSITEHEKFFGEYPYNYVKNDVLWNMYIGGIREADICIASGKHPKDNMIKEGANKVEIIPLGCDIPSSEKIKLLPINFNTNFNIGYLGAIGPDKGLYYLIKAWELLNYKDSTLIFAGPNSEYLHQFIQQYAKTGRFHVMGFVKEPTELYNRCSLYIQPSATEGFGLEIPEAMSYGRSIICSDGAGAADLITEGKDGFVVPKMNIEALAEKIDWCKNHEKETEQMGENAKEKAKEYTWEKTEKKYVNLWKSILT